MTKTLIPAPTSHLRLGHARTDITPPIGIYHRMWGAARHDRSTGVHRPLFGEVMAFGPLTEKTPALLRAQLDLVGLVRSQHDDLVRAMAEAAGLPEARVLLTFSHTHSSGWFAPDRFGLPGGELIPPYLKSLASWLGETCRRAVAGMQESVITYATGRCDMAANRDAYDAAFGGHVCGFNPDAPADDTLLVARVTDTAGGLTGTFVHYACHPTTLAWENTLLSPDYVGALREEVERTTGAPCIFLQGACGDLGPRDGFVGDTAVADRNGRQVGFAALSALNAMGPPLTDFQYRGPVISGATLGTWTDAPIGDGRRKEVTRIAGGAFTLDLPLKPRLDPGSIQDDLDRWEAEQRAADRAGNAVAARDFGARAERARRWLTRLVEIPQGPTCPLTCSVFQLGDAVWVTSGGEPYNFIQTELRRRFPDRTILFSPLASGAYVAYLLRADCYGRGLYQEEPSALAPGCLEMLTDGIEEKIRKILEE